MFSFMKLGFMKKSMNESRCAHIYNRQRLKINYGKMRQITFHHGKNNLINRIKRNSIPITY